MTPAVLALTQGDPAGIGPELLLRVVRERPAAARWRPLLIAERAALDAAAAGAPELAEVAERLEPRATAPAAAEWATLADDAVVLVDPVGSRRLVRPGASGPDDAAGALAALDLGLELTRAAAAAALVTGPVSKASIARHCRSDFRGHTGYLAAACGCERYGRDYLMAFLAPQLQVALLTTHLPLREALAAVTGEAVREALGCLDRHAGGRLAVAGLNPHAGEGGLLGREDAEVVAPAVTAARERGIDAWGPEAPDSLFARALRGAFDWVLALYHDQGLVAVKTAAFGRAVNWTLGLPVLRTSVDHGTAFEIAGRGAADAAPLRHVIEVTLDLLAGRLPRRAARREP